MTTEAKSYMRLALALADRGRGRTSPNPSVGAVIVREGRVVGEGYTQPPGGPHAEIVALRQAGELTRGATLYTTLEPCSYYGRTPPCANAIVQAGITRVIVAVLDPNPKVQGAGLAILEAAGVEVVVGAESETAIEIIEDFAYYVLNSRPFVIAKWAMTLDGKIATRTGHSRWITGEESRLFAHEIRDTVGAILVGVNTVIADDPSLTVRLPEERRHRPERPSPIRVVLDASGRTPLASQLLSPELAPRTIIATTPNSPASFRESVESLGARVLVLPEEPNPADSNPQGAPRVSLPSLMKCLFDLELSSVLVEGGGRLLGSLFDQRLVDRVYAFIAPSVIGGSGAPSPVSGLGVSLAGDALRLRNVRVKSLGGDTLITGLVA